MGYNETSGGKLTVRASSSKQNNRIALPTIFGIALVLYLIDQATKYLVIRYLPLGDWWSLTPEIARLARFTHITNTGAAFGMFPQLGTFFMLVAVVVIFGIVVFYHRLPIKSVWVRLSLGLQLGGAMGNLSDRIFRGSVVDFIDIGFWPIFNIADAAIVLGVAMLAYYFWQQENAATESSGISGENN